MKKYQYLKNLCNKIKSDKFDEMKYRSQKSYYGSLIFTEPVFVSYGKIGYTVRIWWEGDMHEQSEVKYDYELGKLTIDGKPYQHAINLAYLEEEDINLSSEGLWEDKPYSVELECYTDAGGDMIIDLEEPTKKELENYADNFDINEEVVIWWPNGQPGNGVPFSNVKEHYEDLEDYVKRIKVVAKNMPY